MGQAANDGSFLNIWLMTQVITNSITFIVGLIEVVQFWVAQRKAADTTRVEESELKHAVAKGNAAEE